MMSQQYALRHHSEFYSKQADHCRWLARNSTNPHTVEKLNALARDFDARAAVMQARKKNRI